MDRKERIFAYMNSRDYVPLKLEELAFVLDVPKSDIPALIGILDELSDEGKIFLTKRNRYESTKKQGLLAGILRCSGYGFFGFVTPDAAAEQDIFVHGDKLGGALDGDRVLVHPDGKDLRTGKQEGHIVRILEHNNTQLTGIIQRDAGEMLLIKPDSLRIYAKILSPIADAPDAQPGDRVVVEITDYGQENTLSGHILKVLGDASTLQSNIDAILWTAGIQQDFPAEALAQAEAISEELSEQDLEDRLDLRDKLTFTIDGKDAKDFDDAVSIEVLKNGNYSLGVHIADVTHYVTPGSPLDQAAFSRGTSVYLPGRVIPMLPTVLSNGICSLNPRVDRLTLSALMEVNKNGDTISFALKKSVIRSAERMTYDDVAALLAGGDKVLEQRYAALLPALRHMADLAAILFRRRTQRGSINFDFPESKIIVDDGGEPMDIVRVERKISHKMIEEFMLLANETIAEYAYWAELPFVYRVHEAPDPEKIRDLNQFVSHFGLSIKGKFDADNPVHPKALQQLLAGAQELDEAHMISVYVLRSLMKADYRPVNAGHFGLSAKYYCHFTSPIRRYPDLAIHRILKHFLDQGDVTGKYESFTAKASVHSSQTERTAEEAERDTEDLMKAHYMSQFIGQTFPAVVSGVTGFGIFVELENTVEGLIRLENLHDDFYVFDEDRRMITGARTGRSFQIGDALDVTLVSTDILSRTIQFLPAQDATQKNIDALHRQSRRQHVQTNRSGKRKSHKKHPAKRRGKHHGKF